MQVLRKLFRRSTVLIAMAAILVSQPVYSQFNSFYMDNDIWFYDENDRLLRCDLGGGSNLEKIYRFFLSKELSPIHAAGAVGNISVETEGATDPFIVERHNTRTDLPKSTQDPASLPEVSGWPGDPNIVRQPGWGLIQWTPAKKFDDLAKDIGISQPYDLEMQLEVIWWHMENSTPLSITGFLDRYLATTSIEAATELYMKEMEGPEVPHLERREQAARLALDYAGTSGASSACSNGGAAMGDAIQTALNYAHHDSHDAPYFIMKPEYQKAVDLAGRNGNFVGGGDRPGIDCNGFVTRVMEDSGIDPDYNPGPGRDAENQWTYLQSSDKYMKVEPDDIKPGDVAYNAVHAYMYVGQIDGFETEVASASYGGGGFPDSWRTPMAGWELAGDPSYEWFRFLGKAAHNDDDHQH